MKGVMGRFETFFKFVRNKNSLYAELNIFKIYVVRPVMKLIDCQFIFNTHAKIY